jgi:hypothetical protein
MPLELLLRLNAQITASYAQNAVHAVSSVETRQKLVKHYHSSISSKSYP